MGREEGSRSGRSWVGEQIRSKYIMHNSQGINIIINTIILKRVVRIRYKNVDLASGDSTTCLLGALGHQKKISDSLELESQVYVSCNVHAKNRT